MAYLRIPSSFLISIKKNSGDQIIFTRLMNLLKFSEFFGSAKKKIKNLIFNSWDGVYFILPRVDVQPWVQSDLKCFHRDVHVK